MLHHKLHKKRPLVTLKSNAAKQKLEVPLKREQLKALQYLISASCYITVLESSQDNIRNLRECCGKYYHCDGNDIMGKANDFIEGKFRYRVLWEDSSGQTGSTISSGFGHLSGAYRSSIKQVICQSTLTGSKLLDGRSFITKAKAAIAECKICCRSGWTFW